MLSSTNLSAMALACLLSGHLTAQKRAATAATPPPPRVSRYVPSLALNFSALLPPPPAEGTSAARADLAAVHRAQTTRTKTEVLAAQRDDHEETIFAFSTVLGPAFRAEDLPLTTTLSTRLRAESGVINPALKIAFGRPRPFLRDHTIHPVCDQAPTNSYPSGHSMVGYLEAFALIQMIPEKSDAILARAHEFAEHRIVCGVHYPTDVEASRIVALALFGAISTSPRFQEELAATRAELRQRLGLP